jgi:hypothetical protein
MTAAVLTFSHPKHEACIRWWGMVLQFFGIVLLISDVRGAQREFSQQGLSERMRQKLREWPRGNVTLSLGGAAGFATIGGFGRITVRTPTDPSAAVDARLSALEQNFARLDQELGQTQKDLDAERSARTEAVKAEESARSQADRAIEEKVAKVTAGSFTFSLFGAVWLTVGLVLSSTSVETSKWIAALAKLTGWHW